MNIKTEFGNFMRLSDLFTFMRIENKDKIFVKSADYWGAEFITNSTFTRNEIRQALTGCF